MIRSLPGRVRRVANLPGRWVPCIGAARTVGCGMSHEYLSKKDLEREDVDALLESPGGTIDARKMIRFRQAELYIDTLWEKHGGLSHAIVVARHHPALRALCTEAARRVGDDECTEGDVKEACRAWWDAWRIALANGVLRP